jgi:predicted transposase YbfD/YdcC
MLRRQARWILKRIPESLGESNAEIQEGFPRLAGSTGAQCPSRFARYHRHRAGCDAVRGARRNRHGAVCSLEGETAAVIPAVGVRHPKPRHVQPSIAGAGPASLRANLSEVRGSLRQGQRDQAYRRHCCRRQSAARRLRTRPKRHAVAYGQCLRGRSPNGAGLAQGAWPQRSQRSVGRPVHAVARRLCRYRRCAALQSAVCRDRAQTWRSLCIGAQAKPGQTVRCRRAALCPRRQAQRRQAIGTIHPRPSRIPACHRHSRHQCRCRKSLSRRGRHRAHHLAQTPPWQPRRQAGCALYLLSKYIPAKRLLQIVRSHWGIENRLHWVLDVVFGEDRNRTRKDNGPENLAILRRLAINIIRSHPNPTSMRQKIKRAGWDDAFLLDLLGHMR